MSKLQLADLPIGSACAECGSRVTYERTPTGERIPVDVTPTPKGKYELRDSMLIVVAEGQQLRLGDKPGERFDSHLDTCLARKGSVAL